MYIKFNCEKYMKKRKEKLEITCKKQDSKSVLSIFLEPNYKALRITR